MSPNGLYVCTCILVLMMGLVGSWIWWLTQFYELRFTVRIIIVVLGAAVFPIGLCGAIWLSILYINWLSQELELAELKEASRRAEADI